MVEIPRVLGEWAMWFFLIPFVQACVIPLLIAFFFPKFKVLVRGDKSPRAEDDVVGFDLGIYSCITLLGSGLLTASRFSGSVEGSESAPEDLQHFLVGLFILFMFFGSVLGIMVLLFRKHGWDGDNINTRMKNGVNAFGFAMLVAAFFLTGSSPQ